MIEQLLFNRDLETQKDREDFFHPRIENYQKEINIPGIPTALKRIDRAKARQELIVVFGDYDVDGICASTIMYKALTEMGAKVLPYIPHREKEGYGLNRTGLEFARDSGASLVVTVDNGIVALEQARYARKLGLDLIITDHHLPLSEKPEALSLVHSTEMCGAAVAWCLIKDRISQESRVELLQFVAIASVTDVMPMVDVTRAFVVEGLRELNKTQNLGLLALFEESGVALGSLGTFEVGFVIGPRLNAVGRLEHSIDALRLLCTNNPARARSLARLICEKNGQRQQMTAVALEEAGVMISAHSDKKIHVLSSQSWAPGIIGLVAGRIAESSGRPAIAISVGEEVSKGSARSVDGVNIVEVIRGCADILVDVGGHRGAAGFTIANEHIEAFTSRIEKALEGLPEETASSLVVEAEVPSAKLSKSLAGELQKFAPFGPANPQPVLVTKLMRVSDIRALSGGKHLKFRADGIDAIGFYLGDLSSQLAEGQRLDVAYNLEINKFNGSETLQLRVRDIQIP